MTKADAEVAARPSESIAIACQEPFAALWVRLEQQATDPLLKAMALARDSHREAIARAALGEPPPEAEWRQKIAGYRRDAASAVLDPFILVAEHKVPAAAIDRIFTEVHAEASSACDRLPEGVEVPWSPTALSPTANDGLMRRLGKMVARVVSHARHAGSARSVPIRAVARRHLDRNVEPGQSAAAIEAMLAWTGWWAALESAFSDWGEAALPVLMASEGMDEEDDLASEDAWRVVADAATTLDAALEALSDVAPNEAPSNLATSDLDRVRGLLDADLSLAGSFLLRLDGDGVPPVAERVHRAAEGSVAWQHQSLARLRLQAALLAISSGTAGVQQRLVARIRASCLATAPTLATLSERLGDLATELRGESPDRLEERLADVRARAEVTLADALGAVPGKADMVTVVRDGADTTVDALLAMVRQVPAELTLHELARTPPRRVRSVDTRSIGLQRMAREAFDALRVERVRTAVLEMLETFSAAVASVADLSEVVSFGLDAALEEARSEEAGAAERAVELAAKALERASESVQGLPSALEEAIAQGAGDVAEEIAKGCEGLMERVESGRMEAQLLAARSRVSDLRVRVVAFAGPRLRRWFRVLHLVWYRLRRGATLVLRRGSAIVGSEPTAHERSARTVRALATVTDLMQSLPLVYQRLFSFEPLADLALMAGRDAEVAEAMARWTRWQNADGIPLLVRGRAGSGVTSFLNALTEKLGASDAHVVSLTFDRRIATDRELASLLGSTLGLGPVESMDDLARQVLRAPEASIPDAVVLDELEHLYLRVPGGTTLLERLLTFMSETEPRVFWIGGVATSAWQLIARVEPTAEAQVDALDLGLLTADACRQAVLLRHRRSGLQVRYEEPREGRRLLKRRLRRLRGTQVHQEILEADFFDRLHRASLGHVNLALFQWLVAADFDSGDGEVLMHPVTPGDFSVLDSLSLTQNFTLKAFIEHRTLTLAEHDAIFRIPRRESYQILETLANRHLIESVGREDRGHAESEIVEGVRYKVLPLLTGAIIDHLQARNIVH